MSATCRQYKGTVIAVTHDRYFLDNVAEWILELDRGIGIPFRGNYSSWLEQKQARLRREEKADTRRIGTLERELRVDSQSPGAWQAKGQARVTAYEKLLSQETERRREDMQIYIPPGPRLGDVVIDFRDVTKGYDDRLLFEKLSFQMPPGVILGVIGPNGAGKMDAAPADHRPGTARRRIAPDRPDRQAGLRGSEPGHPGQRKERVGGDHGRG